jgi:hypothetical protein
MKTSIRDTHLGKLTVPRARSQRFGERPVDAPAGAGEPLGAAFVGLDALTLLSASSVSDG